MVGAQARRGELLALVVQPLQGLGWVREVGGMHLMVEEVVLVLVLAQPLLALLLRPSYVRR